MSQINQDEKLISCDSSDQMHKENLNNFDETDLVEINKDSNMILQQVTKSLKIKNKKSDFPNKRKLVKTKTADDVNITDPF